MRLGIPTEYAGIRFRSRLEATWAAFFDLIGWVWEYETIDLAGYIPDFTLRTGLPDHHQGILIEVKPAVSETELLDAACKVNLTANSIVNSSNRHSQPRRIACSGKASSGPDVRYEAQDDLESGMNAQLTLGCFAPPLRSDLGQWHTEPKLAARMVEWAGIRPGMRVLEPSAGGDNIVRALLMAGAEYGRRRLIGGREAA